MLSEGKKRILFVNACVRKDSRTRRLAGHLLGLLGGNAEEARLEDAAFPVADEAFLSKRDGLIAEGRLDDPMFALARQFAEADTVVIAAPCWDHSFPAALKQYIEQISVVGLTFRYNEDNRPVGLCRGKRLYYVTTAGGEIFRPEFGFGYIDFLARSVFGFEETKQFCAENLDVWGADVEGILKRTTEEMDRTVSG